MRTILPTVKIAHSSSYWHKLGGKSSATLGCWFCSYWDGTVLCGRKCEGWSVDDSDQREWQCI